MTNLYCLLFSPSVLFWGKAQALYHFIWTIFDWEGRGETTTERLGSERNNAASFLLQSPPFVITTILRSSQEYFEERSPHAIPNKHRQFQIYCNCPITSSFHLSRTSMFQDLPAYLVAKMTDSMTDWYTSVLNFWHSHKGLHPMEMLF